MKEVKSRFKVWGTTKQYEVVEYVDGTYSCNCPAWIYHRGTKIDCKHIIDLRNKQIYHLQYVEQKVGNTKPNSDIKNAIVEPVIEPKIEKDFKKDENSSQMSKDYLTFHTLIF